MRAIGLFRQPAPAASQPGGPSPDDVASENSFRIYCRHNGHRLLGIVTDADVNSIYSRLTDNFSGPGDRPSLVLIPDSSHLADCLDTFVERLIELRSEGAEVRCLQPDLPDPLQNGLDKLSLTGKSSRSQRRIREAILRKASRGEVLGRTPYGYTAGLDGQLKVNAEEAEVVRTIFNAYAGTGLAGAPQTGDGLGLRKIAALLNGRGSRTRRGNAWTPIAIAGVLRNRAYVGTYTRYGVRISGSHEPLVNRDTFNRVRRVLKSRRPVRKARSLEPYLLGGIARCVTCGQGVFGLTRRRTWQRKDGERVSRTYRYYQCPSRGVPAGEESGPHPSWRAEDLEKKVLDELARQARNGGLTSGRVNTAVTEESAGPSSKLVTTEREFMRAVRAVASGYGNVDNLRGPLSRLELVRESESRAEASADPAELLSAVFGDDAEEARKALYQLVERVSVSHDRVEVLPRSGNGTASAHPTDGESPEAQPAGPAAIR